MMSGNTIRDRAGDLAMANALMIEALEILDQYHHAAAVHLDFAITKLELRPDGEGFPPARDEDGE